MRRLGLAVVASLLMLSSEAQAAKVAMPPKATPAQLPPGSAAQSVHLQQVKIRMAPGLPWATYAFGPFCLGQQTVRWEGASREELPLDEYDEVFARELKSLAFQVVGDPDDMFAENSGSDLVVGAQVTNVSVYVCEGRNDFLREARADGWAVMEVEWQVYSPLEKVVVAKIKTHGGFELAKAATTGIAQILDGVFAENTRALAASETFRAAVLKAPTDRSVAAKAPGGLTRLALQGPGDAAKRPISDAAGAVVTVLTSNGMGSGFLISKDGHLITNQHVVGEGRLVKIRWSDRIETVGEVVRSDKRRDVALIKTDPRGRKPLVLRRGGLAPGATVFAVGTPLDQAFENTVTRGVVSGTRIFDGFNYIQSDVSVTHGNSGGPLLDENGAVVGLTVAGVEPDGVPTNINLFIPVADALDFLAADVR